MILALAVALGLVLSLVRFRSRTVSRIASTPLRAAWLALIAVVLQLPLLKSSGGSVQRLGLQQMLFLVSHVLLLVFVWLNRRLVSILIVGLGVLSNLVVILVNGGWMPITPETLSQINPGSTPARWTIGAHYGGSKDVIRLREETRLWELSDRLVLPPPFPWPTAFSAGDLLIAAGIIVLLQGVSGPDTAGRNMGEALRQPP